MATAPPSRPTAKNSRPIKRRRASSRRAESSYSHRPERTTAQDEEGTMTERRAKPKARGASRAIKPRKPAASSKSAPKAGAQGRSGAQAQRASGKAASRLIGERIRSLGDWRAKALAEVRRLIHE